MKIVKCFIHKYLNLISNDVIITEIIVSIEMSNEFLHHHLLTGGKQMI